MFHDTTTTIARLQAHPRARRPDRGRRLRDRLLVARLPAPVPGRHPQDRPRLRRVRRGRTRRVGVRPCDRRARPDARAADRRRGHRGAGPARAPAQPRLRVRPGLPVRPAGLGRAPRSARSACRRSIGAELIGRRSTSGRRPVRSPCRSAAEAGSRCSSCTPSSSGSSSACSLGGRPAGLAVDPLPVRLARSVSGFAVQVVLFSDPVTRPGRRSRCAALRRCRPRSSSSPCSRNVRIAGLPIVGRRRGLQPRGDRRQRRLHAGLAGGAGGGRHGPGRRLLEQRGRRPTRARVR